MIEGVPVYVSIVFVLTVLATLILFYLALQNTTPKNYILLCLIIWLIIQAVVSLKGFYYTTAKSFPPGFTLLVFPAVLIILVLFITKKGRNFMDGLSLVNLAYLHIVRIPVEIVLYWLFLYKAVPELMTFSGRNFDILAGITAPLVAYYGIQRKKWSNKIILAWNFIALGLLFNIVVNAVLSAPFVFQKFAFDQPNIAVLYFPFVWLPCFIVPIALFSHLVSIRQLLKPKIASI